MKKISSILMLLIALISFNASAVTFTLKFSNPDGVSFSSALSKVSVEDKGNGVYSVTGTGSYSNTATFKFTNAYTEDDFSIINESTSEAVESGGTTWKLTNNGSSLAVYGDSGWTDGAAYIVKMGNDDNDEEDKSNSVILKFSDPTIIEKVTDGSSNSIISLVPDDNGEISIDYNAIATPYIYLEEGYDMESVVNETTNTILKENDVWSYSDSVVSFYLNNAVNIKHLVSAGDTILFTSKELTTGISAIDVEDKNADTKVFDLFGRRVNGMDIDKGIYIVNGKKILK